MMIFGRTKLNISVGIRDRRGGEDSYYVAWDGLHLGNPNPAQIINGLGEHDDVYPAISREDLNALITSGETEIVEGEVWQQVAFFFGGTELGGSSTDATFTTLRPSVGDTAGTATFSLDDNWTTSQPIDGTYGANASAPLSDLLDAMYAAGGDTGVALLSYGVYASDSAKVASITWGGETTTFGFDQSSSYAPTGDPIATSLSDLTVSDAEQAAEVCEGIVLGVNDGIAEPLFDVDPISVGGETIEQRWVELMSIFNSLDGYYTYEDPAHGYGTISLEYGFDQDDTFSVTLQPFGNSTFGEVSIGGDGTPSIDAGETALLGDVIQDLIDSDYSVWVTGFSIQNADGPIVLRDLQFYDNVNLVFGAACETDDPETDDGQEEPAKGVAAKPAYAG